MQTSDLRCGSGLDPAQHHGYCGKLRSHVANDILLCLVRPAAGPRGWLLLDGLYRLGLEQVFGGLLPQPGLP